MVFGKIGARGGRRPGDLDGGARVRARERWRIYTEDLEGGSGSRKTEVRRPGNLRGGVQGNSREGRRWAAQASGGGGLGGRGDGRRNKNESVCS